MKTSNDTIKNWTCKLLISGIHNCVLAVNNYDVICCVVCNWRGKEPHSGRRMGANTCNPYILLPVCIVISHLMGSFHCLYGRFCDSVCRWNDWWSRVSASHETETWKKRWKKLLPDYRQRQNSGCRTKRECCAVSSGWNTIMKIVVFYRVWIFYALFE